MKSKTYYRIEATEKIVDANGALASGDNVHSDEVKTLKTAMKMCEKWISDENIYSVWIYKISTDYGCTEQWCRYSDENKWRHTIHN